MKQEQMQQAQNLYFQTNLSKVEIADILNVSRRSVHNWIDENHWDIIKTSSGHMPCQMAENCYYILARLQEDILSEARSTKPVTPQEVNMMHKLTVTISKLKTRATLNETLEMQASFMDYINQQSPGLADALKPLVDSYILSRAKAQHMQRKVEDNPARWVSEKDAEEARLGSEGHLSWAGNPGLAPAATEEHQVIAPEHTQQPAAKPIQPATGLKQSMDMLKAQGLNRAQRRKMCRTAIGKNKNAKVAA